MDVDLVIKARLAELGFEQRDLAAAAEVTESYISQLLTRKKLPPAPARTDIYEKMGKFLKLSSGRLAELADAQRTQKLKQAFEAPPAPLYEDVREMILRKCTPERQLQLRDTFEQQPFGELERLVTQKLLDVTKRIAREELENETWLDAVAQLSGQSYEQMRVIVLEFLDTDIFNISGENCVTFLDPLINSWDIDLSNFGMEIVLNQRLVPGRPRRFEFVERAPDELVEEEPGLTEFLQDSALSGDATQDEIEFLRRLRFEGKRPRPLYYYRELQNLRDAIHFRTGGP
jgi:transcriptional regulator with XRE-family HTH domain